MMVAAGCWHWVIKRQQPICDDDELAAAKDHDKTTSPAAKPAADKPVDDIESQTSACSMVVSPITSFNTDAGVSADDQHVMAETVRQWRAQKAARDAMQCTDARNAGTAGFTDNAPPQKLSKQVSASSIPDSCFNVRRSTTCASGQLLPTACKSACLPVSASAGSNVVSPRRRPHPWLTPTEHILTWRDTVGSDGYQSSCPGCMVTCTQQEPGWKVYDAGQKPVRLFTHLMTDTMPPMMRVLLVVDSAWSGCCPADLQGGSCGDSSESKELGSVFNLAMGLSVDLKFPINSLIGQGAHGQVHRALYQGIMPVAVKLLTLSDMPTHALEAIRSFAPRLSNMSHQLPHPNIVHCCGGNLAAADPFIVMELCSCSLEQLLHAHSPAAWGLVRLPLQLTLEIGADVVTALRHSHRSCNRDLTPSNIYMVGGRAKVAFKPQWLSSTKLANWTVLSSVAYMAPEWLNGDGSVSEKSDMYAVGIILWECITGVQPWGHLQTPVEVVTEVSGRFTDLV
eukprot:jgi/Chrzof1/3314/Cz12g20180.t1